LRAFDFEGDDAAGLSSIFAAGENGSEEEIEELF
jgi:hypothetical protein